LHRTRIWRPRMPNLNIGDEVPDFELPAVVGSIKQQFKLSDYRGKKNVVLAISAVSIPSHTAWQKKEIGTMSFPLASDFYPHGAVAKIFGIQREGDPLPGVNERAVFIVDKNGKLAFAKIYPLGQVPSNEDIFEVLKKL